MNWVDDHLRKQPQPGEDEELRSISPRPRSILPLGTPTHLQPKPVPDFEDLSSISKGTHPVFNFSLPGPLLHPLTLSALSVPKSRTRPAPLLQRVGCVLAKRKCSATSSGPEQIPGWAAAAAPSAAPETPRRRRQPQGVPQMPWSGRSARFQSVSLILVPDARDLEGPRQSRDLAFLPGCARGFLACTIISVCCNFPWPVHAPISRLRSDWRSRGATVCGAKGLIPPLPGDSSLGASWHQVRPLSSEAF